MSQPTNPETNMKASWKITIKTRAKTVKWIRTGDDMATVVAGAVDEAAWFTGAPVALISVTPVR